MFNAFFRDEDVPQRNEMTRLTAIAAALGLSGYFLWDLQCVFMYATPFAESLEDTEVITLRICWILGTIASLVAVRSLSDKLHRLRYSPLDVGATASLIPLTVSAAHTVAPDLVPLAICAPAWMLAGVAQAAMLLSWMTLLSLSPTRHTPAVIACASALGTCLYVVVALTSIPVIGIAITATLVISSLLALKMLTRLIPKERVEATEAQETIDYVTPQGAISIGTYGLAFGYTTTILFSIGPTATIVGCMTGIAASLATSVWQRAGTSIDMDISTLQRITLPPTVIGILFMPFGEDTWKLLFCCLVNVALCHFSVGSLSITTTFNSEFQIKPLRRSAEMQIPVWTGLLLGTLISSFVWILNIFQPNDLMFISSVIASLIVCAIAIYGMDDTSTKKQFDDLITKRNEDAILAQENDRANEAFDSNFQSLIEEIGLSPREKEVFRLLAKGRNADYIGKNLVISPSTAKSHIYHIYRKMGINSQQSLIDKLDEFHNQQTLDRASSEKKR